MTFPVNHRSLSGAMLCQKTLSTALRVKRVADWPSTAKIFQQRTPGTPKKLKLIAVRYRPLLIRYVLHGARHTTCVFSTQMKTNVSTNPSLDNRVRVEFQVHTSKFGLFLFWLALMEIVSRARVVTRCKCI